MFININSLDIINDSIVVKNDGIYKIDDIKDCINISVLANDVCFIDSTKNKELHINIKENINVNYIIVNSNNSKRYFEVSGILNINQISLTETDEVLNVNLVNEHSEFYSNLLTVSKTNKFTFNQYVNHNNKYTKSDISNVSVAFNGASVLFDTTGKINKGMTNSNCHQLSRGMVIDDDSKITSKPILLIDEFDCFASHGAAIGKLKDEDLFYLMSRGLNKNDAFMLILSGIVRPFIDRLKYDELKKDVEDEINNLISNI